MNRIYRMNMIIPVFNQVSYWKKSLKIFSPKLSNSLPYHIKSSENLESFKRPIKLWNEERCVCKYVIVVNKQLFVLV